MPLMAVLMPPMALAQQNIMKAWDRFKSNSHMTLIGEKHSIDKDPQTGQKTYHLEYWTFSVPKDGLRDIEAFAEAFDQDANKAYSVNKGTTSKADEVQLAVGTDANNIGTAFVGSNKGSQYVYCLFLDPEDPEGRYRYSYSLNWIMKGDSYEGTFLITYATTLKYRQSQGSQQLQYLTMYQPTESWFTQFMTLASTIDKVGPSSRKYTAGQMFDLAKSAPTEADKEAAIDVVNSLLPEIENKLKDPVTAAILRNCIKNLQQQ